MKRLFIISFFSFFHFHFAQAQIMAPDFLCVSGDSLIWNLPVNTCGPFVSYEVFSSTNFAGPYVKIADVTDPTQDFYFDLNPSGEQRWYFLQSNFNCPGEPVFQSDTLDNRPPEVSPINSLGVGPNGEVQLEWQASPSPEVFGYIIYRETNLGVVPIDTVFGATNYLDLGAQANSKSERYFVNALDQCGTTSIFDVGHRTIYMEAEVVPCEQGIGMTWSPYEGWPSGIGSQEIYLSEAGAPPILAATLDGMVSSYTVGGLTDGAQYSVTIHAVEASSGARSISNAVTLVVDIVQPSNVFLLENVNVLPGNQVGLTWSWNTNAEITDGQILSAPQNADYQLTETFTPQYPLQDQVQFLDENSNPQDGQIYYRIQSIDECGEASASSYGATVFLSAAALSETMNEVSWTDFDIENSTGDSYDLFRIHDGNETFLTTMPSGETMFVDEFSLDDLTSPTICYRVEAQGRTTSASGVERSISSSSNVGCVKQAIKVFVPNALAPNGINQEFRPVINFEDNVVDYEMSIYDRYGAQVFFTKEIREGWRGKRDGRKLPQGVYVYQITVTEASGEVTEKRGKLLLLR